MSKTKQSYGMDFDDEASKLLEKALSSFDGIILGEIPLEVHCGGGSISTSRTCSSRNTVNKPLLIVLGDSNAHQPSSNVLSAAQTLALALEQCKNSPPSPPDKDTAETINAWLESFMPVSIDLHEKSFCCWSSSNKSTMEKVVQLKISLRPLD